MEIGKAQNTLTLTLSQSSIIDQLAERADDKGKRILRELSVLLGPNNGHDVLDAPNLAKGIGRRHD